MYGEEREAQGESRDGAVGWRSRRFKAGARGGEGGAQRAAWASAVAIVACGGFRRLVSGVKPSFTRDRPPWRLREAEPSAPSWCSMFVDPAVRCCVSVSPATRRMAVAGARAAPRRAANGGAQQTLKQGRGGKSWRHQVAVGRASL